MCWFKWFMEFWFLGIVISELAFSLVFGVRRGWFVVDRAFGISRWCVYGLV